MTTSIQIIKWLFLHTKIVGVKSCFHSMIWYKNNFFQKIIYTEIRKISKEKICTIVEHGSN